MLKTIEGEALAEAINATWEQRAELVAATYLHTTVGNMIWTSQRLLPVGQSMAGQLWWKLKPAILETAQASATLTPEEATTFSPILDSASMRHPDLPTRLFIS